MVRSHAAKMRGANFGKTDTGPLERRLTYPSARSPGIPASPLWRVPKLLLRHRSTPPDAFAQTMTGSRFPGSRVVASNHLPRDNDLQWS